MSIVPEMLELGQCNVKSFIISSLNGSGSAAIGECDVPPNKCESKEESCGEPRTQADGSRNAHNNGHATYDQRRGKDTELPHAVHKNKGKIMSP